MDEFDGLDWKEMPEYPGYRVCSNGSVWSCWNSRWGMGKKWKKMKHTPAGDGYDTVTLYSSCGGRKRYVHRLVLENFVGPQPDGMEACHYPSNDKSNNALSNLMWGTRSENGSHRRECGTQQIGESCHFHKLSESQVLEIRRLAASGVMNKDIAVQFGVGRHHISRIIHRHIWPHLPPETSADSKGGQ